MPIFRRILAPAAGAVALVVLASTAASASVTLNRDWDTCNNSQWTGNSALEAAQPAQQSRITTINRTGTGCANIFEVANTTADKWSNGSYRSMWGQYDSQEGTVGGNDFVYGFSFGIPQTGWKYESIWELHQRSNIYNVAPALSIAPHAILIRNGQLQYREMTGAGVWNGSAWTGYSNYQDQVPLTGTLTAGVWYDVMVHIRTAEDSTGLVEVYVRQAGQAWPASPTWVNHGPSLPYIPGGKDPRIPNKISTYDTTGGYSGLYLEAGLYTGSTTWQESLQTMDLYMDNLRRYSDLTSARAGLPN